MTFLELWKTSQPDNASDLRTDGVSIKRRKADEVSVGGRFQITSFHVILMETIVQSREILRVMFFLDVTCVYVTVVGGPRSFPQTDTRS